MKYVIYLRVSTKLQDTRTQLDLCLKYLSNLNGKEFKYMVCTDEITSRKPYQKRSGLQSALKSLQNGDILVAMRLDRLARNLHETTCIIHELEIKGADIMMVDQPGIKNKVLLGMYAGVAEEEVKMIRKRITEKLNAKRMRNERISHCIPYGYKLDMENLIPIKNQNRDGGFTMKPSLLVPDLEEQKVLSHMERLFDAGNSYREIVKTLTELGYRNRQGKPFQHMSIYRILSRTGRAMSSDQPLEETEDLFVHSELLAS